MDTKIKQPGWPFYPAWIALSSLAIVLAFGGTFAICSRHTLDWRLDYDRRPGAYHRRLFVQFRFPTVSLAFYERVAICFVVPIPAQNRLVDLSNRVGMGALSSLLLFSRSDS